MIKKGLHPITEIIILIMVTVAMAMMISTFVDSLYKFGEPEAEEYNLTTYMIVVGSNITLMWNGTTWIPTNKSFGLPVG